MIFIHLHIHMHTYIWRCLCCSPANLPQQGSFYHTRLLHTHIYMYIPGRLIRARPRRAQGGHKSPAYRAPGEPTRARPAAAS